MLFLVGNELEAIPQKSGGGKVAARVSRNKTEQIQQKAKVVKTPSLKETLNKIDSIGKEQHNAEEKSSAKNVARQDIADITQDDITQHFGVFLDKIKKGQPRLYSSLKNQTPILSEKGVVALYFQNNSLLEEFKQRIKPTMISYYRNTLNGAEIEVQEYVQDAEKIAKPNFMNDAEKFKQMSDKNPALVKLKSLFNLDFD